ncbi:MAG: hypothetical protein Q4B17_00930 [Lautropia sp.]|nr:hypothetical protein [Lautropia sp.]
MKSHTASPSPIASPAGNASMHIGLQPPAAAPRIDRPVPVASSLPARLWLPLSILALTLGMGACGGGSATGRPSLPGGTVRDASQATGQPNPPDSQPSGPATGGHDSNAQAGATSSGNTSAGAVSQSGSPDTAAPQHPHQHDTSGQPPHQPGDMPIVTQPPHISETSPDYLASCDTLSAQPLVLRSGMLRYADPATTRPAFGRPHKDPVHQSCVTRVTDQATNHPAQYWGTQTPRRQVFNADSSAFLLNARNGSWRVHDARTGQLVRQLDHIHGVNAEPQWHATDPNLIHYLPNNGQGMQIHELRVDRNESRLLADLGPQIRQHWPQATHAWTVGQGSPSADGRYWCLLAEHNAADDSGWQPHGVFTWDMQTGRIIGTMSLTDTASGKNYRPSYISTSPSGQHCLVAAPYPVGSRVYRRDFSSPANSPGKAAYLQVSTEDHDADMAFNRQGEDIYVSVNYNHGQGRGEVYMVNLDTGARTHLFDNHIGGTIGGLQFSGRGYQEPGWMLVSSHAERTHGPDPSAWVRNLRHEHPSRQWHHRKLFAINLDPVGGRPEVKSIANMHNDWWLPDPTQVHSWPTPNASVSRDFSRILFNSTWNSDDPKDVDAYLVRIPAGSLERRP